MKSRKGHGQGVLNYHTYGSWELWPRQKHIDACIVCYHSMLLALGGALVHQQEEITIALQRYEKLKLFQCP